MSRNCIKIIISRIQKKLEPFVLLIFLGVLLNSNILIGQQKLYSARMAIDMVKKQGLKKIDGEKGKDVRVEYYLSQKDTVYVLGWFDYPDTDIKHDRLNWLTKRATATKSDSTGFKIFYNEKGEIFKELYTINNKINRGVTYRNGFNTHNDTIPDYVKVYRKDGEWRDFHKDGYYLKEFDFNRYNRNHVILEYFYPIKKYSNSDELHDKYKLYKNGDEYFKFYEDGASAEYRKTPSSENLIIQDSKYGRKSNLYIKYSDITKTEIYEVDYWIKDSVVYSNMHWNTKTKRSSGPPRGTCKIFKEGQYVNIPLQAILSQYLKDRKKWMQKEKIIKLFKMIDTLKEEIEQDKKYIKKSKQEMIELSIRNSKFDKEYYTVKLPETILFTNDSLVNLDHPKENFVTYHFKGKSKQELRRQLLKMSTGGESLRLDIGPAPGLFLYSKKILDPKTFDDENTIFFKHSFKESAHYSDVMINYTLRVEVIDEKLVFYFEDINTNIELPSQKRKRKKKKENSLDIKRKPSDHWAEIVVNNFLEYTYRLILDKIKPK